MTLSTFDTPRSLHNRTPGLLKGDARFALTFAGQGGEYLQELASLRKASRRARLLIDEVSAALTSHVAKDDSGFFVEGFEPLRWIGSDSTQRLLAGEGTLPSADAPCSPAYLAAVPVSFPLIFLTQLAHFERLRDTGFDPRGRTTLAAGHSQGVMAAVAVSLAWKDGDLLSRAIPLAKFCLQAGLRMQQAWPMRERGNDDPSPMAAITGLMHSELQALIGDLPIEITLDNTLYRQVVSADPAMLEAFRVRLQSRLEQKRKARAKGLAGGRAPSAEWVYLPVSAPFHSQAMAPALSPLRADVDALNLRWSTSDLCIPVLDTETGAPLTGDLMTRLIEIQCVRPVSWRRMSDAIVESGAGHVLDFGPGDALSKLTQSTLKGAPIHVWPTTTDHIVAALSAPDAPKLPAPMDYQEPRTRRTSPVILAGMTPTTVDVEIVAAAANAGFTAELAGGGQVTEAILRRRLDEALTLLEPGRGLVFNALYLDPYLWKLHFGGKRLVERLATEGYPIVGVTISAGVPPLDEAVSLLRSLHRVGVTLNSLKPGNDREIGEAIAIAKAVAPLPLVIQIEGGKAGGHHSWEDLDDLLLRHYPALRALANVQIVAGGGIGSKAQVADYLSGAWSQRYGSRRMPIDAVLVGTAAMVCQEAKTSPAVKQALCAARGTDRWVNDAQVDGGVTSGRSQLDASIHYLDTAAAQAGRLLDKLAGRVAGHEGEIAEALARTAKPFFGDVQTMSYGAWLQRLVELTAFGQNGAYEDGVWPDASYRERFRRCLQLAEARLCEDKSTPFPARITSTEPTLALQQLHAHYPNANDTRVHPEDARSFIDICRIPGKPVCFVPIIDADVRRWYKSDSLWQAHDPRFSADQVLTLPGPQALTHVTQVDQPVADLLRELSSLAPHSASHPVNETVISPTQTEIDDPARFFARLAALGTSPVARMLRADQCFDPHTGRMQPNPLRAVLHPEPAMQVRAEYSATGALTGITSVDGEGRERLSLTEAGASVYVPSANGRLDLCLQWRGYLACDQAERVQAQARFFGQAMRAGRPDTYAYATADSAGDTRGPIGVAFVLAWEAIFAELLTCKVDLLRLVHETCTIDVEAWPPTSSCQAKAHVIAVDVTADGRRVRIGAQLTQETHVVARLTTQFFVREATRPSGVERRMVRIKVRDEAERCFLSEQPWWQGALEIGAEYDCEVTPENEPVLGLLAVSTQRPALNATPKARYVVRSPRTMDAYAAASGDMNPLHLDAVVARLAGLRAPIVHGMWTAAVAAHRVARSYATPSHAVRSLHVEFVAPLPRGTDVDVLVEQTGYERGGPMSVFTLTAHGETVLQGRATLRAPETAYVFPGQGIQTRGMGMAGYARSAAARAVWDEADAYTQRALGFSLLHVVRDNPNTLTVSGERLTHPNGVLFLTQFTQVSMVVLAMAQVAELRAEGALVPHALFAGHSVGEYSALSALGGALPLQTVVEVVYRRGLTMDRFVPRDAHGRSPFAMGVIRPRHAGITEQEMFELVERAREGDALEIVNFNIRGRQYSVTGHVAALARLQALLGPQGYVAVPGIDVPFHSTLLRDGVAEFRATLDAAFPPQIDANVLVGRYVPNLTAKAFSLSTEYISDVIALTGTDRLAGAVTARTLLIELLAFQFASPVRWIETQELFFSAVERFVEVGLAEQPTLMNMALATREAVQPKHLGMTITCSEHQAVAANASAAAADSPRVDRAQAQSGSKGAPPAPTHTGTNASLDASAAGAEKPASNTAVSNTAVRDVAFSHSAGLRALLAWHLKLPITDLAQQTLDELCGGNSAKRNQVLADIAQEFQIVSVDGAHDMPLDALARALADKAPRYAQPGKFLRTLTEQRLLPLLQTSRLNPRDYLRSEWALPEGLSEHVIIEMLLATRQGSPDTTKPHPWVDACVTACTQRLGSPAQRAKRAGATAIDDKALLALDAKVFGAEGLLAQTAALLQSHLPQSTGVVAQGADPRMAAYEREHSDEYLRLVTGLFSPDKALAFTSAWAWGRRAVFAAYHEDITPRPVDATALAMAQTLAQRAEKNGHHEAAQRLRAFTLAPAPCGLTVLVTGAGPGSIALALVNRLLAQGARVVATTSSFGPQRLDLYKQSFVAHAIAGAELHIVPFNQGSLQDTDALVAWLASRGLLPDRVLPFAALSEIGTMQDVSARSLATLRVQLLGIERLLAGLCTHGKPAHVVLPLSPNHGVFGGDGMYAETKAALEVLLAKWHSEPWGKTLSVSGARIGWVRGTGLMAANDGLADALEHETGLQTFTPEVMADKILSECFAPTAQPQVVSLTGGFETVTDLAEEVRRLRTDRKTADKLASLRARTSAPATLIEPTSDLRAIAPRPRALDTLPPLDHLDLDRMVVVVGYGEVGPWGSARTRWTMERDGVLSLEAALELAWMMGLIEPSDTGFVDASTKAPISELQVKARYEAQIVQHAGIRLVDPQLAGFDPAAIMTHVEVHLDRDFTFVVPTEEQALAFSYADNGHTRVQALDDGSYRVTRARGATLRVPRALGIGRNVVGQIPTGWSAERYGIPREMVAQVDRATLFNLIATVEAFLSAGLEPEELYAYLHPTRVGTTQSSGIGGMQKLVRLYQDGKLGRERQADVLQETLVNVIAGWTVQAYLGSYGPISSPVGACATAALSVAEACDKIAAGRADFVVTGGSDDYGEEGAIGFADMGATADSDEAEKRGVSPARLSRPNDANRSGFVEAHGAGTLLLARASTALKMALPVYGVVAYAASHSDGIHASVPAPGQGLLAVACETKHGEEMRQDACGFTARRAEIAALPAQFKRVVGSRLAHDLQRPEVSPLRAALAVYGLQADDIAFVSKHDTSTKANDKNENRLHAALQKQLGRSEHLPLYVVSQKSLTGHPKGAAAAWQMIGALQAMADDTLPGNASLNDVDPEMQHMGPLVFSATPQKVREPLKAALVTSLGFGHVGALVCLLHSAFFWRVLCDEDRAEYERRLAAREQAMTQKLRRVVAGRDPLVVRRTQRAYENDLQESAMLLDAEVRL